MEVYFIYGLKCVKNKIIEQDFLLPLPAALLVILLNYRELLRELIKLKQLRPVFPMVVS